MNAERFMLSLGVGLTTSFVSGAFDAKRLRESSDGAVDVVFCTVAWTAICAFAMNCALEVPAFLPISISIVVRTATNAQILLSKIESILRRE